MVKILQPNPLNVFEIRRVDYCPPYFESINLPLTYNLQESIERWIESNLKGRYYIGRSVDLIDNKIQNNLLKISFEESKEMSYFMLACPHLKYK
jgi:hypothetical protein